MKASVILRLHRCLLLGLFLSGPVFAQTGDAPSASGHDSPAYVTQARKAIDDVLAKPEFDRTRIIKKPKLKELPAEEDNGLLDAFLKWLDKLLQDNSQSESQSDSRSKPKSSDSSRKSSNDLGRVFAQSGQMILWLLAFVLIALLVIYSRHWLPFFGWRRSRADSMSSIQQVDSTLESAEALPEDIATVAERYWNEGQKVKALSLLYRGTIELLTAHHCIDFPQGATEEEIRLLVGSALPSLKEDFGSIARAWLRLAYAHRPPADIVDLLAGFSRLRQAEGTAS
ncbi:MAG: DUF4129 domain-containing protein [Betaproteobacteria bacterium]|nr:DUF4129 domain-containing protein [Betaproteobacteria bacterium]